MNTIGMKKQMTGYYKTEGSYNKVESNENKNYYLNKVPEAI